MKREHVLRGKKNFAILFAQGKRTSVKALQLIYLAASQEQKVHPDRSLIAFCVGKKLGNAVRRNRVKRELREIVQKTWPRVSSGYWLALIPHTGWHKLNPHEKKAATEELLQKAGVWQKQS